ncbi:MAG: hypothetical protein ABI690_04270 [Chloroflexota bacterium]
MNPNENHVSPLEAQIDRLIETNRPTGIPAADDLAATIPQARPDFQQQLEDRLTAQIQFASHGDEKLTSITSTISKRLRPRAYLPLTLAAAMLAVVLVGSFLLLQGGKKPDSNLASVSEATVTPTPVRMVSIVVALQNLPPNYRFPATTAELAGSAGYKSFPEYSIPAYALREDQGGLDQLAGKILRTGAFTNATILSDMLLGSNVMTLPADQLVITLPISLLEGMNADIQVGAQVDISALVAFVRGSNEYSDMTMQKIARNATVIHLGDFPPAAPSTAAPDMITVSASRDEVETLAFLLNAEIPMTIELSGSPTATILPTIANTQATAVPFGFQPGIIPQGMRAAEIDRDLITNDLSGFKADDTVDIAVSFLTINKNADFAGDPSVDNTTMPDNAFVATKTVFTGVRILVMGGISNQTDPQHISVALDPANANLLTWVLASHLPIALTVTHADASDLAIENLPDGRISVEVPISNINTDKSNLQSTNTANVLARMNFTNYDPNNSGSFVAKTLVSQIIIRDAEMTSSLGTINTGDFTYVKLIITPDELPALAWAIKANLPLALQIRLE